MGLGLKGEIAVPKLSMTLKRNLLTGLFRVVKTRLTAITVLEMYSLEGQDKRKWPQAVSGKVLIRK